MKRHFLSVLACIGILNAFAAQGNGVKEVKLAGYIGGRIDGCIEKRVLGQSVDELVEPFKAQDETKGRWASEFWGKWIQGAVASYEYNHDPALLEKIKEGERKLIATQLDDGYIGDYDKEHQLHGWDVWGRKYTLLGLVKCYRLTGNKEALEAACKLLDYTISQIGPDSSTPIYKTGYYRGMPPLSILEPVTYLYDETGKPAYLQFAKLIAEQMNSPEGPMLIDKADTPVSQRFVLKPGDSWWSFDNGQKGYEMMSCYIGLLEMYRLTGNSQYLQVALTTWNHILREEINITGGACSLECWYGGHGKQTHPASHTMETCVTFTWMQFCERLLQITGDTKYVDQIERTMYNALMASMKHDNSQIVKYVPLEGFRREGEHQCDVHINCCNANAPRAFAMIPRVTYRVPNKDRIDVNLYMPSQAILQTGKRTFTLTQQTGYPASNEVKITVTPDKTTQANIALRIPGWTPNAIVKVNGETMKGVASGEYYVINRQWNAGDEITLTMEMPAHLVSLNQSVAIERGPIVYARDSRFNDGFVDEVVTIPNKDGIIQMKTEENGKDMWITVSVPMVRGTYNDASTDTRHIRLCDFASTGSTWDERIRYRVWLPKLYTPDNRKSGQFQGYW
ncbi:MAG: glycoside hydrolase family 127 protein [Bacteroidaceae bacterium]|nr:glycoside hydrolase family 127 protein [Bacteroidaceae bacterium]